MVEFDNGKISTALVTILGVLAAAFIAQPELLQAFMGSMYAQYGAAVLAVLVAIYNLYYPRQ